MRITVSAWSALKEFYRDDDDDQEPANSELLSWSRQLSIGCLGHAEGIMGVTTGQTKVIAQTRNFDVVLGW